MRQEISLNQSWYFSKGETIPKTVEMAKEQGFCEIQVPHTYNGWDGQDGGGDYYKGKAVYLKEIKKPDIPADSRVHCGNLYKRGKGKGTSGRIFCVSGRRDRKAGRWKVGSVGCCGR